MQQPYVVMAARQVRDDCRSLILALIIEHENFTARIVLTSSDSIHSAIERASLRAGTSMENKWLSPCFPGVMVRQEREGNAGY